MALEESMGGLSIADRDKDKEARGDDGEWFKDVDVKYQTKSQFMRFKAGTRTKNIFNETKRKLCSNDSDDPEMKRKKEEVIENFDMKLKANNYYEERFDRTSNSEEKLCNEDGVFVCQGAYNEPSCPFDGRHINPYLSKSYCREFSSWNFNHRIQIGREVLPQLKEAVEKTPPREKVNLDYFYGLLFTNENFKLVCNKCYDIKNDKGRVDDKKVFLPV